jgi:hypothetical protein
LELNRPRVIDRTEWSVTQKPNGDLEFSANDVNGAGDKLRAFLGNQHDLMVDRQGDKLTITLRPDSLDGFMQIFSDDAVRNNVRTRLGG